MGMLVIPDAWNRGLIKMQNGGSPTTPVAKRSNITVAILHAFFHPLHLHWKNFRSPFLLISHSPDNYNFMWKSFEQLNNLVSLC